MIKTHLFLMKNRARKKWKLNKQVFHLTFDFTTLIYSLFIIGYMFIAIFLDGNMLKQIDELFIGVEAFSKDRFWFIVTAFPVFHLLRAYQQPGVLFTTAEYLLTSLPNPRAYVWLAVAIKRWIRALIIYLIAGTSLYLFSPTSFPLIVTYVCLMLFLNVLMTIPEWKFFQLHIWGKMGITLFFIILNILSFIIPSFWIGISFLTLLIIYNIRTAPKLFKGIDWNKVTAACDFKLWNMVIVSHASKVKFKKERQYSVWQRLSFWKKPFPYEKKAVYHRLWHLYIEKNISFVLQIVGALLLMLFVFVFIKDTLFLFAIALTIHIYTNLIVSMFRDRLVTDIVEALPWDLNVFKQTLLKWSVIPSLIFIFPYAIFAYYHLSFWLLPQFIIIMFTFRFLIIMKLEKVIQAFDDTQKLREWVEFLVYGLLLILIFSNMYPLLLILGCFIIGVIPFFQGRR